ncbi:MAG: hypothetical protein ACWGSD_18540, partial [Thermodesulfobacteriota bacterium]
VDQAFAYAKATGMRVIVGAPFPEVLPLVDKKVKQYDIKVAIHNHGSGDDRYPTPEAAIEKVKNLDQRIGLCMDIGHTSRIGFTICILKMFRPPPPTGRRSRSAGESSTSRRF